MKNRVRLMQVAGMGGKVALFDLLALRGLSPELAAILVNPYITKVGFNVRFDASNLLRHFGVELVGAVDLYAGAVLASGYADIHRKGAHTLEAEVERHLHLALPKDQAVSNWGAPYLTLAQLAYAARDAAVLLPLYDRIVDEVERAGVERAWGLECSIIPAVVAMEAAGFAVDRARLEALAGTAQAEAEAAARRARDALGDISLNINSHQQLKNRVKLTYGITLNGASEEILETNIADAPALGDVLAFRRATKRAQAAVGYIGAIQPEGRIHARFNPMAAPTGRFGCSHPSLHAVPRDEAFRRSFIAGEGYKLIIADYNAIQLRIAAHLTGDVELTGCFTSTPPIDPHRRTASFITRKLMEQITKNERQLAKAVNFGFIFGMGAPRFVAYARDSYGVLITLEQARSFRQHFMTLYRGIQAWHTQTSRVCISAPGARTASGRLRLLPPVNGHPLHTEFLNTPVQGTEADGRRQRLPFSIRGSRRSAPSSRTASMMSWSSAPRPRTPRRSRRWLWSAWSPVCSSSSHRCRWWSRRSSLTPG